MTPPKMHAVQDIKPDEKDVLLSEKIRSIRDQLANALKQAHYTGHPVAIGPDFFVSILELTRQLAYRVEALEGVEHTEPMIKPKPKPDENGKAKIEERGVILQP